MESDFFKSVTLGEISKKQKGSYGIAASAVDYSKELPTYLRITDISEDGYLLTDNLTSVDDSKSESYILEPNDIVFARTGNSTGKSYFFDGTDGELVYAGFLIKFSLDSTKVNPKYIRFYTLSNQYLGWVKSFSTGSTRANINAKMYKNMKIKLPPRKYQDFVVNVLSTFEEKMKQNNMIISNLEELAQTLFKHWFVEFEFPNENGEPYKSSGGKMVESELGMIPEGWAAGILSEVAEIVMGQSPKSATYNEESIGTPLINGASDFKKDIINPLKYTTDPKRLSEKGDFLFGVRATVGNVTYVDQEYALGRGVGIARVTEKIYKEYLYFQLISGIETLKSSATGSVYINFTRKDLTDMKLVIADKKTINLFHDKVNNLLKKKHLLLQQNRILIELRDTLLPKLLSGEIELPDTMEVNEDVSIS